MNSIEIYSIGNELNNSHLCDIFEHHFERLVEEKKIINLLLGGHPNIDINYSYYVLSDIAYTNEVLSYQINTDLTTLEQIINIIGVRGNTYRNVVDFVKEHPEFSENFIADIYGYYLIDINDVIELLPISEIGSFRIGILNTTYSDILNKIFKPNTTKFDDRRKVKASWGFKDNKGRKGFIWCINHIGKKENCTEWSIDGNIELLIEIFGSNIITI